jgi:hypothetical protein
MWRHRAGWRSTLPKHWSRWSRGGVGWALITPLCLLQARADVETVAAFALPDPGFSRELTLVSRRGEYGELPRSIAKIGGEIFRTEWQPRLAQLAAVARECGDGCLITSARKKRRASRRSSLERRDPFALGRGSTSGALDEGKSRRNVPATASAPATLAQLSRRDVRRPVPRLCTDTVAAELCVCTGTETGIGDGRRC